MRGAIQANERRPKTTKTRTEVKQSDFLERRSVNEEQNENRSSFTAAIHTFDETEKSSDENYENFLN